MTEVAYLIYADKQGASTRPGANDIEVVNPRTVLQPYNVPGSFSFSIVVALTDINLDVRQHSFKFRMIDENGKEVAVINSGNVTFPAVIKTSNIPNKYLGVNLGLDFQNVNFDHEGVYTGEFHFDGELLKEKSIYVASQNK